MILFQKVKKLIYMRLLTLFIITFFPLLIFAQGYSFQNYSVEEGLPQSQVSTIIQDKAGYIWMGTINGGIARFDGKSFRTYNTKSGISSNNINFLFEDSKGIIWICTSNGITLFDGNYFSYMNKTFGIKNVNRVREFDKGVFWIADLDRGLFKFDGKNVVRFTKADGLADNRVIDIVMDKEGKYWIATQGGLSVYDGKNFVTVKKKNDFAEKNIRSIFKDKKGNIWLGHNGFITKYDGKNFNTVSSNEIRNTWVESIFEDHKGYLWLCTERGLFRFDGMKFLSVNISENSRNKMIRSIMEDREHNLWVGTDVCGASKLTVTYFTNFDEKDGLPGDCVWSIIEDRKGCLWFGTDNGVARYDGTKFNSYGKAEGIPGSIVYSVYEDNKGLLWAGTSDGLAVLQNNKFKYLTLDKNRSKTVLSIAEDGQNNLWVGTLDGVYKYKGKTFKYYPLNDSITVDVITIFKDKSGKLWFCSEFNGVYIFDGNSFTKFDMQNGLNSDRIWDVIQDEKGNYWFGHAENGLIMYDPSTKRYVNFTTRDGLIDDAVYSMKLDKNGDLWLGTNSGISCFEVNQYYKTGNKFFINFDKLDGFTGIECNQKAICADSKENIWFGTIKGASKFTPSKEFREFGLYEPFIYITGIKLFLEESISSRWSEGLDPQSQLPINLELPYDKNHITFNFIGLSFINPERVFYSYRMTGADKAWSPPSKITHVTYTNLTPGNYTFEVRACNKDGIWNASTAKFSFSIKPPYWSTWWFILMIVTGVACIILLYINFRTFHLEKQKKELEEIIALRTKQLQDEKEKETITNQELEYMNESLAEANRNLAFSNRELEKLSIVARETDNSIYITDSKGDIEWINASTVRMTGFTLDELIAEKGRNLHQISSHPNIGIIIANCMERKKSISYETVNTTKSGSKYWTACTLTPILDNAGRIKNLVIIETNITDRKVIEQELQIAYEELENRVEERTKELQKSNRLLKTEISQRENIEKELIVAKEKAEQADRLKSAFLAQISHEIRTPLNVILSYTTLLRDQMVEQLSDELKSVFFGISNAGNRLIRTIDLILNMSAIQTGTHDLSLKIFPLDEKINKLITEFRSISKEKKITISFETRIKDMNVYADEYTVDQIFQNLIDNAIKYTPEGNIDIVIYKDEFQKTCVDVKDNGIGISEEFLPNLFQPFTQEEMGYTRKYEGNGLGLALVKNYVDMNSAEIYVDSKKGEGSTFTVKFKCD